MLYFTNISFFFFKDNLFEAKTLIKGFLSCANTRFCFLVKGITLCNELYANWAKTLICLFVNSSNSFRRMNGFTPAKVNIDRKGLSILMRSAILGV